MSEIIEEIWKPIPLYEEYYEASNLGNIRSCARKVLAGYGSYRSIKSKVLKPSKDKDGYLLVSISNAIETNKSKRVHCLIMLTFVGPPPPGKQVCHWDGEPTNCKLENLRYGTGKENWEDRERHGRGVDGIQNPNAKLTIEQIEKLKSLKCKITYAEAGRQFNISPEHASKIMKGF